MKQIFIVSLLLFINFTITSCDENKVAPDAISKNYSNGANVAKANFSELIDKIGDKDVKLIELIKNNPISKLKNINLQKTASETSEFCFDTKNIMALKNDKAQAVYIIPVYKNSSVRDNNLYTISINIQGNGIDTKLNTIEIKSDGSKSYLTRNFNYAISGSKNSKVKDMECYCTVSVSDCTCHTTHADGGCDHPDISIFCGSCSGGGSGGSGFSTGADSGSSLSSGQIATVWGSSSSYGYSYNYTGSSVYIGLTKIYSPAYVFSSLQKYNIIESKDISNTLLEFLNTDGKSQMNKDFAVSVIDAIENGTVTNYQEFSVLLNAYKYIKYNRTASDTDSGDIDNNSIGGYDNTVYSDFNPQQAPWPTVSSIIPISQFIGFGAEGIRRNCMDYAKAQIAKMGYKISNYGDIGQTFKIYREQTGVNQIELSKGLSYLKYAISNGIPVIVGVDDAPGVPLNSNGTPGNIDLTTDHFIVIVGMGTNSQGNYFQFYDNASGYATQGANPTNLLYYNSNNGLISGKSQTSYAQTVGLHNYIITQIRKSKLAL